MVDRTSTEGDTSEHSAATKISKKLKYGYWSLSDIILCLVLSIIVGSGMSLGAEFYHTSGSPDYWSPSMWGIGAGIAVVVALLFLGLVACWNRRWSRSSHKGTDCDAPDASYAEGASMGGRRVADRIKRVNPHLVRLVMCLGVVLIWLPAIIVFFPGNYSSDAPLQLSAYYNGHVLDAHWPLAHTLFLVACFNTGFHLFGNLSAGVFLYCLAQLLFLAFALSFAADRLIRWNVPVGVVVGAFAIIVFNPVVQTYAMTTAKDSLFSGFLLLTGVLLVQVLRDTSNLRDWKFVVEFCLACLGMSLLRKQGLYVLLIVCLIAVCMSSLHKKRVRFAAIVAVPVCAAVIFPVVVGWCFPVQQSQVLDELSLARQQIVATYMYDNSSLSASEKERIWEYFDKSSLDAGLNSEYPWEGMPGVGRYYNSQTGTGYLEPLTDVAGIDMKTDYTKQHLAGFISLYCELALHHPYRFTTAFLWGSMGYVYPTTLADNRWSGLAPWNEFGVQLGIASSEAQPVDYHQSWKPQKLLAWYCDAAEFFAKAPASTPWGTPSSRYLPFLRLLVPWVSPALPFFALILSLLLIGSRRKFLRGASRKMADGTAHRGDEFALGAGSATFVAMTLVWLLAMLYWLTLFVSPVMCGRYALPLFLLIPLLLCVPWISSLAYRQAERQRENVERTAVEGTGANA
ncbi:DUF6020 family protein [Pseudoscardovia suis]|uniref:Glycosyltransferase RgtA/B/C/D-like domain-containing protein n=1 Tax=Pseudoscardovia suis TaxID=987063 RepID=A0A261EX13_9BIFI|nr:DUF6020 family protein [Pseudoscardovia suis]OZG51410.1 hypothetical protein PSSU_1033 [Pseudoscardovia suis]PJJ68707.1 hypothetical protein CLV65_0610 [Pseudoscardovia suis]